MESICCNLCGRDDSRLLFSKWNLNLVQCVSCGLCYINPRVFLVEADDYFRGAYLSTIETDGVTRPNILQIYHEILDRLSVYLVPGKLLDVGCAMGHFMREAQQQQWTVFGTECSPYAAAYSREQHGLQTQTVCDLRAANFPESHFDASVLIEVAEHLPDPKATFAEVFRVLKPGGVIYVTTPNFASFRALLRRQNWDAVIPTGHLFYFTGESLISMLQSVGFTDFQNLTPPAGFESELHSAQESQSLTLTPVETERLLDSANKQDQGKISNGRAEGLVVLAVKPNEAGSTYSASRRPRGRADLEGKLVCTSGSTPEDQKVFYVHRGTRYWVTSIAWLEQRGLNLQDAVQIDKSDLNCLTLGPSLA